MTTITAALVKELRERTGAGMMECKNALVGSNGDLEQAIEAMRKSGQAKAVKKGSRTAAEGTMVVLSTEDAKHAVLVEINCETDFVAREETFKQFAESVARIALDEGIQSCEALQNRTDEARLALVGQLGENITVRRFVAHQVDTGVIGAYGHGDANGVRIGVLVVLNAGTLTLAKDLAMHVAAMNPEYLIAADVPADRLEKEKSIFLAQILEEGKSPDIAEKMLVGKIKKFLTDVTLEGQAFVKDPAQSIGSLLKAQSASINTFVRFAVGEGIEKKEDNFAEEVLAQVRGA